MTLTRRAMILAALAAAAGCFHRHHEEPPPQIVYEPGYYDRGYYRGEDWYWRDREGYEHHEAREAHERRMRNWGREGERERR